MFITVHLTPAAATVRLGRATGADDGLGQTLADLGVDLEPLHPGTADPELAGQFYASVADAAAAETCAHLRQHPAVVAAYPKAAGSPPAASTP